MSHRKGVAYLRTAVWSVLHFLVDMVCAWAMYAFFCVGNYESLLIYNFCAFALQLPFGTLLDLYREKLRGAPTICASIGVAATILGALLHPGLLGIGNALFHTGAGVDVIEEDFARNRQGRNLGIFVAPGAIGLYLGTLLDKNTDNQLILVSAGVCMLILLLCRRRWGFTYEQRKYPQQSQSMRVVLLAVFCFTVVVIRSLVGLAISFPWKSIPLLGALAVCGAATGKCCGGFFAARFGLRRTAAVTLLLASLCYLLGDVVIFGIAAIFLFNMTMPLTLYLLAENLSDMPGFAFGLLTFALFLGFLPVYWQMELILAPGVLGAAGSVVSCVLLLGAGKVVAYDKLSS